MSQVSKWRSKNVLRISRGRWWWWRKSRNVCCLSWCTADQKEKSWRGKWGKRPIYDWAIFPVTTSTSSLLAFTRRSDNYFDSFNHQYFLITSTAGSGRVFEQQISMLMIVGVGEEDDSNNDDADVMLRGSGDITPNLGRWWWGWWWWWGCWWWWEQWWRDRRRGSGATSASWSSATAADKTPLQRENQPDYSIRHFVILF